MRYIKYYKAKVINFLKAIYNMLFNRKKLNFESGKKYAFIMLSADYENLGDIAITSCQEEFLRNILDEQYQIIKVDVEDTYSIYYDMKKHIAEDSIITLIGGGNSGYIYEFIEAKRRFILKKFKNNIIISFPQTVLYNDSFEEKRAKSKFVALCSKCRNLTLMARENNTYQKYKQMGLENVELVPDIVFSKQYISENIKREGIALILRNDKEKSFSGELQENIIKEIIDNNEKVEYMDTCNFSRTKNEYTNTLTEYLKKVSSKKMVITDRLHGMIFCYITNTPCIVFDNNNNKISGTYNTWLKNQNFIFLVAPAKDEVTKAISKAVEINHIKKENLKEKFNVIIERMKQLGD